MSDLFDKESDIIGLHLKNIFSEEELEASSTTKDFSVVEQEGKRLVKRIISNEALASLTLFAAASNTEEMETVKRLIIIVLNRNQ